MIHRDFNYWRSLFQRDRKAYFTELAGHLRGFITKESRAAIRSAVTDPAELEARRLSNKETGPLEGVPFLVKDLFDVAGELTGCSAPLMDRVGAPAVQDALLVQQFRNLGALVVGRTHMNEFAYGLDGFNPHFGNCSNAISPNRISGGSSSGSAWAVATGVVPLAFGTDTGGSIRVPAAYNGIYGFRRPVDRYARCGVFPLAPTFDTVGWFTGSSHDMRESIDSAVADGGSAETMRRALLYVPASVEFDPDTVAATVGVAETFAGRSVEIASTERGLESPEDEERRVLTELDRIAEDAKHAYNVIGSTEAFGIHQPWLDDHRDAYDPGVWRLIDRARHWPEGAVERALAVQKEVRELFEAAFQTCHVIAMPAVYGPPPLAGDVGASYRSNTLQLNCYASLAQVPVLTVPLRLKSGLSVGVQFLFPPDASRRAISVLDVL